MPQIDQAATSELARQGPQMPLIWIGNLISLDVDDRRSTLDVAEPARWDLGHDEVGDRRVAEVKEVTGVIKDEAILADGAAIAAGLVFGLNDDETTMRGNRAASLRIVKERRRTQASRARTQDDDIDKDVVATIRRDGGRHERNGSARRRP